MNNLPIRALVLLLALAPLTIIALLISLHSSVNRIRDLNNRLHDHGQAIARQLAPACEYGVFAGNRELLTRLVQAAVREQDVVRVTVNEVNGEILARAENAALAEGYSPNRALTFQAPIDRSEVNIDDFAEESAGHQTASTRLSPQRLGLVSVPVSDAATSTRGMEVVVRRPGLSPLRVALSAPAAPAAWPGQRRVVGCRHECARHADTDREPRHYPRRFAHHRDRKSVV